MANDKTNGAQVLIDRILDKARQDADATLQEAQGQCEQIKQDAKKQAEIDAANAKKAEDEAVRAILERSRTNAELLARKNALLKRRTVLDSVFDEAYKKLCGLDEGARGKLNARMLLNEAEGGELVLPAAADRKLIEALLPTVNSQLKGKAPLKLSDSNATSISNGFLLMGNGYEKDCSFLAALRESRAKEDTKVSGILFD